MSPPRHLLKPNGLVVVDVQIVAAILHKYVHHVDSLFNFATFEQKHRANRINCSISRIQVSGFFVQPGCPLSVTRFLVNQPLQSVQFEKGGRMRNCKVDIFERIFDVSAEEVVLRCEVVEPELDGGVLLNFVRCMKGQLSFH